MCNPVAIMAVGQGLALMQQQDQADQVNRAADRQEKAIEHGRVKLNGDRVKPARDVKPSDRLELHVGDFDWVITVRALAMQRGPAPVAQLLYEEDPASHTRRQQLVSERKLGASPAAAIKGRPTKRDRRQIHRFTGE